MHKPSSILGILFAALFLIGMIPAEDDLSVSYRTRTWQAPPVAQRGANAVAAQPPVVAVRPFDAADLYVHAPPSPGKLPLRVVVALHGMGGEGKNFAQRLTAAADKQGWLIIAPTIHYHNYLDIPQLVGDDLYYSKVLRATLDALPQQLKLQVRSRVVILGFSRGAQLAHRFALIYPDQVLAVAAVSAGSYTLPEAEKWENGHEQTLPFPLGVSDFRQRVGADLNYQHLKTVRFWVGVGGNDNHAGDVARAFDSCQGSNRIERAQAFISALQEQGVTARLTIFPNTGHELTPTMSNAAFDFFHEVESVSGTD